MKTSRGLRYETPSQLILPIFSGIHGHLLTVALEGAGKPWVVLSERTPEVVEKGLSAINNDSCYEAFSIVGQILEMDGLNDGDIVVIPQICQKCRVMDLLSIVKLALEEKRMNEIKVVSLESLMGDQILTKVGIDFRIQKRCAQAIVLGDVLLQLKSMFLIEANHSDTFTYMLKAAETFLRQKQNDSIVDFASRLFDEVAASSAFKERPIIGIVGTAPLVFDENMNLRVVKVIEGEGCRAALPYLSDYVRFALVENGIDCVFLHELNHALARIEESSLPFVKPKSPLALRSYVEGVIPQELTYGAGWLLAARMAHFIDQGITDIAYVGSFGCLSGHVMGRGIFKWVRSLSDEVNIANVEFDPGTSAVNQVNRIKLLAAIAKKKWGFARMCGWIFAS